ncbi:hypothetical protein LCI18_003193 [Fusarium solani-melongenae]|uniref:Uncharacterized protein n=1 Tax=Fusarium solani subsp. cucurbitae TaxID=2747967 RepID=A0ACD3YTF3_FUSSC|nr:hypothetical protein LCI18_003193 [Fusarium solani-melongenae]
MTREERRPLLSETDAGRARYACGAEVPILVAGFIITLSFSLTQVPILYVFHLMECDIFYQNNPPYTGIGDKCNRDEIAAATATQFSILGMSTTFCGTLNLFVAGWLAKRLGPRAALLIQTLVPAIRAIAQILGVTAGGWPGIITFQCTQLIAIIGGPAGYVLIVNIMVSEVVEPIRRTSVFGKLQGCIMLGQGVGYFAGGMIGDLFGIQQPFEVAFLCFLLATFYARIALPCVAPEATLDSQAINKGASGFFSPLKILLPQRVRLRSGQIANHYGVLFLCCGVFLGVLATDYAPFMIQMYATAEFSFNQAENGWLMSGWAIMRSCFLLLLFPRIISRGRKWFAPRGSNGVANTDGQRSDATLHDENFDTLIESWSSGDPTSTQSSDPDSTHLGFDLFFLRWSLVIDGVLTTIAAFATHRWHIYLAAFLLPLGSGSAPAAKGVITDMCSSSQRADALNAITLVENIARLATQGIFGFLFAFLAAVGKAYLTFFCNAAIAVLGTGVLLLSHFPPHGSELLVEDEETNTANTCEADVQGPSCG